MHQQKINKKRTAILHTTILNRVSVICIVYSVLVLRALFWISYLFGIVYRVLFITSKNVQELDTIPIRPCSI